MPGFTEVESRILTKYISDISLSRSLTSIREVMENIWANEAPRIVKDYTDHGEEHSKRVAYFVEKLLQANPDAKFSQQEIYVLLAGIYLHDIGMQCDIVKYPEIKKKAEDLGANFKEEFIAKTTGGYSLEEQKEIRKNHHLLSAAWIDYLYEGRDTVLSHRIKSIPYDLVDDLIDVCKFHSKLSISDCPDCFGDYPSSRKKMVAAILRFADELDISSTRVKIETVKIFSINPENSIYWWLHNYTKINFVAINKINFKVNLHPEDFKLYSSFVRENYITNFKNKNKPVLDILVEQRIPVVIDNNSDVVAHTRAEKFPPEITTVLDKKIQNTETYEISIITDSSDKLDTVVHSHVKKLPLETVDLQLLRNNANSYKKSAERCLEQRLLPDGKIESPLVPAIVNLASSIEFYLKFLLAKEGKILSEYRLLDLFKSLDLAAQIDIINTTKYNKNEFELLLGKHSKASVEWRNIHIYGKNKNMSVDIQFMKKLMDSLEFIINRS